MSNTTFSFTNYDSHTPDYGTPELRMKKLSVLQNNPPSMNYTDSLLGILWDQKRINNTMLEAGRYLQTLQHHYTQHFSSEGWSTSSHSIYKEGGGQYSCSIWTYETSHGEEYIYQSWQEILTYLRSLGSRCYKAVLKITLYSSPFDKLVPHELAQCRYGLFCVGNWLYEGKRDRMNLQI